MMRTAHPNEIEAGQAVTGLDLLHAFFDTCAAARGIHLRRIVGDDLARLRAEVRAAAAVVASEQEDVLGVQWASVQREAKVVGALRAALAALRAKTYAMLAILRATAVPSGTAAQHLALARRVSDAVTEKVGHVAHVALTARIAPTGGAGLASTKMLGGLSPA